MQSLTGQQWNFGSTGAVIANKCQFLVSETPRSRRFEHQDYHQGFDQQLAAHLHAEKASSLER
jgi:hypothetical protein